jgi:hypothetical protein
MKQKKSVVASISERSGVGSDFVKNILDSWFGSSNDATSQGWDLASPVVQKTASDVFGSRLSVWQMDNTHYQRYDQKQFDDAKKVLSIMYEDTQKQLKAAGVKEVTVYRGFSSDATLLGKGSKVNVQGNALESWTLSENAAKRYLAKPGDNKVVFKATYPVERIMCTPKTGLGSLLEQEVVILGGTTDDDMAEVVMTKKS